MSTGNQAVITVRRPPKAWGGRLRSFRVEIDGRIAGKVAPGGDWVAGFPVAPGRHTVRVGMDWVRSTPVTVEVEPGTSTVLTIGDRGGSLLKLVLPIVLVVFVAQLGTAYFQGTFPSWTPTTLRGVLLYLVVFIAASAVFNAVVTALWDDYWTFFTLESVAAGVPVT